MTDEGLRQEPSQPLGGGGAVAEGPPAESAFGLPIAVGVEDARTAIAPLALHRAFRAALRALARSDRR